MPAPQTYVALLRGINVGGKHKLPMKDLRRLFDEANATDVRSYIQSGNIVFTAHSAKVARIVRNVEEAIEAQFGFRSPIIIRTHAELIDVSKQNPLYDPQLDPRFQHVAFLAKKPTQKAAKALEDDRFLPDEFVLQNRELFLKYPNGAARSKMSTAYFDKVLSVVSTARNWNTLQKLLQLCSED